MRANLQQSIHQSPYFETSEVLSDGLHQSLHRRLKRLNAHGKLSCIKIRQTLLERRAPEFLCAVPLEPANVENVVLPSLQTPGQQGTVALFQPCQIDLQDFGRFRCGLPLTLSLHDIQVEP